MVVFSFRPDVLRFQVRPRISQCLILNYLAFSSYSVAGKTCQNCIPKILGSGAVYATILWDNNDQKLRVRERSVAGDARGMSGG